MKFNPVPVMAVLLLLPLFTFSQQQPDHKYDLLLKSGTIQPEKNITADKISKISLKIPQTDGKSFLIIQFENIPTEAERKQLQQAGIELLDYIPYNAYTVTVTGSLNQSLLERFNARAVIALSPEQKMQTDLAKGIYPSWAIKVGGTVDVWISFPKTFSFETVSVQIRQKNFDIITTKLSSYRIIGLRVAMNRVAELAAMPFIEFVQPAPPEDEPINNRSTTNSRANILGSSISGGRNLKGQGVVIGVGDNNDPQTHIDFTNRLIDRAALPYVTSSGSRHGTHVTGTAAGAGIANELYTGYAPKAKIINQNSSGILVNASAYVKDDSMMITNNSYEITNGLCSYHGTYDLFSRVLDQQAFDLPKLQHVFAAGNSGSSTCAPYPAGFRTVVGSYQAAKNVIDVGNTFGDGTIYTSSSRGPVKDGRIKPEICALGEAVVSSAGPTPNGYVTAWGTSMASPGVTGGLTLLYQRYKQLNGNINPKSGLMKALICNGGRDLGNAGPDYTYGFGWMNLLRSIDMLENNHYVVSSIANGGSNTHNITVPANSAQLKVMLYWHDPAAAALASQTLINDLDLEVRDASNNLSLPYILDTVPANVNNVAATGTDHINNIEQVVVTNPATGNYTLTIKGTAVTQNPPQEYFVVYDFVPVQTIITHPAGGEKFLPGESITLQWDSYGDPANAFTLEYSTDNGSNWNVINNNVAANLRQLAWTVPSVNTDQALIRVTRNSTAIVSTSQAFTIVGAPSISLAATQCEGYIALQWGAVTGATDYEVMMLRGDEMISMGTITDTIFTISGLSKDTVYWVSVRSRINGNPGRRANAISRQPNSGTCSGTISDNDLKIDALLAPGSGRVFTSSALTATTTISVRIKNLDDAAVNTFNVKYSVNGGAFVSEAGTGPIAAGGTYTHNFAATYNFSTIGSYTLRVVVQNTSAADPVGANDTLTVLIKQLPNAVITLTTGNDFLDDIETADDSTYYRGQIGLSGADRYDFNSSTVYGRVRPFINTGIAYSGDKALTLDADRLNAGTADSLKATFNLSPHTGAPDDLRLDFVYKNHVQGPDNANNIWIRGDDTKPWIVVYDLYNNQLDPGLYKKSSSIELTDLLRTNSQDFSSSFQIRFGQFGYLLAADNESGAGYTFDDIHLYKVDNDIQMKSLDDPVVPSCGLGSSESISVTVRNSADTTVNKVPVKFIVDGGPVSVDTINAIAGNTNVSHTFTTSVDLSVLGTHIIKVWVDYPGDSFRDNDTLTVTIRNSPIIASYPYLENFETNDGNWFSSGKNNSWEYGTPAAAKINRAASGSKAWKTNLTGNYKDQQLSYLYSPCFDITGLTNPTLSLSIALDLEDCGNNDGDLCDGAYVEYSADGVSWTRLGAYGQGKNWYNKQYTGNNLWSVQGYTRWHVATVPLPTGYNRLRLRFVITSDPFVNFEGVAVDDIHIYDNPYGIYDGPPYTSNTINQPTVNGNSWINFTDGGKLIASINPNGRDLGSTNARAYINTGAVRYINGQYYHNRNITIKPTNRTHATDSVSVRFYFLDTETETLINATGCTGCTKPSMAYELGVSKYNDTDTTKENGTITDDVLPGWSFINSATAVKVPFDKGYYSEFKVKDFSEFWLNNGGISNNQALPVQLIGFTAKKSLSKKDVLVEWRTASELNTVRFEVELAKGNEEYQQNRFLKIGEVSSAGNSSTEKYYSFTDAENNKSGVRYYRLKTVDADGRFSYSVVRPVVFNDEITWQVYPNPSHGIFNLVFQATQGENISMKLYDVNGKLVQQASITANGFVQKHSVNLQAGKFASGLYLMEVMVGEKKELFRLIKQ